MLSHSRELCLPHSSCSKNIGDWVKEWMGFPEQKEWETVTRPLLLLESLIEHCSDGPQHSFTLIITTVINSNLCRPRGGCTVTASGKKHTFWVIPGLLYNFHSRQLEARGQQPAHEEWLPGNREELWDGFLASSLWLATSLLEPRSSNFPARSTLPWDQDASLAAPAYPLERNREFRRRTSLL